jgi:hypothetical protein
MALQQADILRGIFDFLSPKSLYSAVRVNRAWHAQAARVLWMRPPESALLRLEPHRQQFYASRMRHVIVPASRRIVVPDGLDANAFPHLWSLTATREHPLSRYKFYLQPRLTHFLFLGCPTPEHAHALAALCPNLRSLFISMRCGGGGGAGSSDTPSSRSGVELADFFRCCALPGRPYYHPLLYAGCRRRHGLALSASAGPNAGIAQVPCQRGRRRCQPRGCGRFPAAERRHRGSVPPATPTQRLDDIDVRPLSVLCYAVCNSSRAACR